MKVFLKEDKGKYMPIAIPIKDRCMNRCKFKRRFKMIIDKITPQPRNIIVQGRECLNTASVIAAINADVGAGKDWLMSIPGCGITPAIP